MNIMSHLGWQCDTYIINLYTTQTRKSYKMVEFKNWIRSHVVKTTNKGDKEGR